MAVINPTEARDDADFRQLLDAAPDAMIVVNERGFIEFANVQTEKVFGYPQAELVGQRLDVLIPTRFRGSHAAHVERYVSSPGTRPMGSGLELYGRRRDGTDIPVEVSLSPVKTTAGLSVCAAIRDISDRKRIEQAAKINAERLASAVETIQDAFALFDAEDRLVLCNSVYRRMIGESLPGPIVGRSYGDLLDAWMADLSFENDDDRAQFRAERLVARKDPKGAFDVQTRDGRSLRVMDRRAVDGGIVKTIWDLTDDVRLAHDLREARAAAESASEAKSEFLSSMSHELRTPMNAILGFAQLLARDKKEPLSLRHKERLDQILRGGEHLLRLIDDILDLSRIEAGRVSISTEPVSVADVLEEVRVTLETAATRAGVRLEVEPPPVLLPAVHADRTRFAQIVMNFGTNAIKYNRAGGLVSLRAAMAEGASVRVTISDTGIGIPVDKQDKLFQPFQRAGQETGPIEGTGIGLVISKRLAELMAGHVGFSSKQGVGSTFWVELPAHVAPTAAQAAAGDREGAAMRLAGHPGRSVLYIEDNPANVAFMRDLLSDLDAIDLLTAPTAEMGVELAIARTPDVIIMDINLPGMSGVEALLHLRATPATTRIPVIALTAAASERDRLRGMQAGFYKYLTKPVKLDELIEALESLLVAPR
jgi:PAS domain S-box-containing protein